MWRAARTVIEIQPRVDKPLPRFSLFASRVLVLAARQVVRMDGRYQDAADRNVQKTDTQVKQPPTANQITVKWWFGERYDCEAQITKSGNDLLTCTLGSPGSTSQLSAARTTDSFRLLRIFCGRCRLFQL